MEKDAFERGIEEPGQALPAPDKFPLDTAAFVEFVLQLCRTLGHDPAQRAVQQQDGSQGQQCDGDTTQGRQPEGAVGDIALHLQIDPVFE